MGLRLLYKDVCKARVRHITMEDNYADMFTSINSQVITFIDFCIVMDENYIRLYNSSLYNNWIKVRREVIG